MTRLDSLLEAYAADLVDIGETPDRRLLRAVAKHCGAAVYRRRGSLVDAADPEEAARVHEDFLLGTLGLRDGERLAAGVAAVNSRYPKKDKHRVVYYYLLAKQFRKRGVLAEG